MPKNQIGEKPFPKSSLDLANKLLQKEIRPAENSRPVQETKPPVSVSSVPPENHSAAVPAVLPKADDPQRKITERYKNDIVKAKKKAEGIKVPTSIGFTADIIDKLDRIIYKRIQTFEGFKKKPSRSSIIEEAIEHFYEREMK
jgi:hypothetical protein